MSKSPTSMSELNALLTQLGPKDVVVDVREPDEFAEGHIAGAINCPLSNIAAYANQLSKYDNLYVHCRAGRRAVGAVETLKQAGLKNLHCIYEDGMAAWEAAGLPMVRGSK